MLRMKCPHCGRFLGIDEIHVGALGLCPACCETFTIPVPAVLLDDSEPAPTGNTQAKETPPDLQAEEIIPGVPLPDDEDPGAGEPLPELTDKDVVSDTPSPEPEPPPVSLSATSHT
jgi:hypothetical protein